MGRPKDPSLPSPTYTPRDFAPDANYPAGTDPWSGQPTKVEPPGAASSGFVPNTGAGAQFFNKLFKDTFNTQADQKTYEQGLRDAEQAFDQAMIDYLGQLPALDFKTPVTCFAFSIATRAKYVAATNTWYVGGGTGGQTAFIRTTDPASFPNINELSGANLISCLAGNFDVDPAGNIVFPGNGNAVDGDKILDYSQAGGTWTKRTGLFAPNLVLPDVVYDSVNARWCVAGEAFTATRVDVWTSTNRSAWTAGTRPAGQPASNGLYPVLGSDDLGNIVMVVYDVVNNNVYACKSTDGGQTWTAFVLLTTATLGGAAATFQRPKWDGSKWIVSVRQTASTAKVYTSPDGVTWTNVSTLTTKSIRSFDLLGGLLCGKTDAGRIIFSKNQGASWRSTDRTIASADTLCAGAGRFITLDGGNGKVYVGIATGMGVEDVT